MLSITGKTLDVTSETIDGPRGSFVSTTIHLLSGEGAQTQVQQVRVAREFPGDRMPHKGEDVTLAVVVSAYPSRNGAGYRLTALSRQDAARKAA